MKKETREWIKAVCWAVVAVVTVLGLFMAVPFVSNLTQMMAVR